MFVYILQSLSHPEQRHIGPTDNIDRRFSEHNQGRSPHTAKFRPWTIKAYMWFEDDQKVREFERYLKGGSGRAFATRHFW